MAYNLPKGVKDPKFSDGEAKEEKKANPIVEEEPEMKEEKKEKVEEAKKAEPTPEVKPAKVEKVSETPTTNVDYDSLGFKKFQPILKSWRIFVPYLFAFLYNLVLFAALAAFVVLPIIRNDTWLRTLTGFDPASKSSGMLLTSELLGLSSLSPNTYSILDVVMYYIGLIIKKEANYITMVGDLWGILLIAIPMLVLVIWFAIKLIHSLIAMITCGFKHRKHHIIDNFFFKNTHQYYKLGILDFDFTFIVFMIFAVINFAIMNIIPLAVALVSKSNPTTGAAIGGFTEAFAPLYNGYVIAEGATEAVYDQTQLLNQGNLIYVIVLGVLVVIRIVYRTLVRLLSRKVRKTYIKSNKQMKADRKAMQAAK